MNRSFTAPEMEIVRFSDEDVIVTSGGECGRRDDGCNCDAYTACMGKDTDNH